MTEPRIVINEREREADLRARGTGPWCPELVLMYEKIGLDLGTLRDTETLREALAACLEPGPLDDAFQKWRDTITIPVVEASQFQDNLAQLVALYERLIARTNVAQPCESARAAAIALEQAFAACRSEVPGDLIRELFYGIPFSQLEPEISEKYTQLEKIRRALALELDTGANDSERVAPRNEAIKQAWSMFEEAGQTYLRNEWCHSEGLGLVLSKQMIGLVRQKVQKKPPGKKHGYTFPPLFGLAIAIWRYDLGIWIPVTLATLCYGAWLISSFWKLYRAEMLLARIAEIEGELCNGFCGEVLSDRLEVLWARGAPVPSVLPGILRTMASRASLG